MHSIPPESLQEAPQSTTLVPSADQAQLIYWHALQPAEQAFVAAYIENGYSVHAAAEVLKINNTEAQRMVGRPNVRRAVTEVQATLDGIDFLNEKWVKTQLLRLFPMAMGDEPVPMVTQTGEETRVRKFHGDIAMKILEYVAPKASKSPAVNISIHNVGRLTDEQLEQIANNGRVVSEQ